MRMRCVAAPTKAADVVRLDTTPDTIVPPSSAFTSTADVLHNATMSNGNVVIHNPLDRTDTLTLMGVKVGHLIANDFTVHGPGALA